MEIRTQERLEHCRRIDDRYSLAVSRHGKKAEANFDRKQHEVDRLLGLENFRAQGPHNAVATFGLGYAGFGNGWTDAKPRILYPKERKRPRRHLREICFSRNTLRHIARVDEVLVPMRLDIDYDKYKLRDVLTWNLFDDTMSIEIFAEHLCEDYGLPLNGFVSEIAKSLKGQLAEHHPHKFPEEVQSGLAATADPERMNYTEARDDDLRVCIKLDITVGALNLVDQIEWDLNNSANDPESYAASFCVELGLSCEFSTAIAHAIREQCQLYTKSLFLAGHTFDGKGVHDSDLRQALMPMIYSSSRPKHHMDQFAPTISDLVPEQLEKIERDREREGRRNRRQTRGKRGVILPDLHDLPKTYRSPHAGERTFDEQIIY
ncbi:protein of unknown function [Taphrina deformans PYCC 5710]|uniref:Uncharacterized protein n=1 Tax=Taphrina deformans (strain PYCC 5710 / ATCC 11124 / CBS 356.35 / IMI 108563 / JCM 9778 / NBRC 8474) TaxID=1097556 RepID=R4XGK0_TAPDE|nr:protein of unknown function [Taphrina deformans PYCC 5710]|eukprot:CCG84777.1 protein of unknown function [Taphrina deformans PYCC 5710]